MRRRVCIRIGETGGRERSRRRVRAASVRLRFRDAARRTDPPISVLGKDGNMTLTSSPASRRITLPSSIYSTAGSLENQPMTEAFEHLSALNTSQRAAAEY